MANSLKKLAGQTAIYGLSSIVGRMLNYLLVPLHTRIFAANEYGVITEMYAYVVFFLVLLTYGMETTFFRYTQKKDDYTRVYTSALVPIFILTFGFILLMQITGQQIAGFLDYQQHPEYIRWFAIIVGIDAFSAIPFAKLRHENRAKRFAFLKIMNIGINVLLNVTFFLLIPFVQKNFGILPGFNPYDVRYVFIANLVATIVNLLFLIPELYPGHLYVNLKWSKQMFVYATPLVIAGFAGMINESLDRVLLKHFIDVPAGIADAKNYVQAQIGIYGANYKLAIFMTLFIQTFRYAAEPFIFSHYKNENARELYAVIMKLFVITGLLIFLGITMYIDVFKYFIGKDFYEGLRIVPILLVANLFLGVNYNIGFWYKLREKTQYGALISITGAVITLLFNIWLIPHLGYMGAAWATLICYSSMMILNFFMGRKFYYVPYDLKWLSIYFFIALAFFLLADNFFNTGEIFSYVIRTLFILTFVFIVFFKERTLAAHFKE